MKRALAVALLAIANPLLAGSQVTANSAAIATSSPIATKVGLGVLKNGGNAIDAAIAVTLILGVVQPNDTGLGGGGFLLYFDAKSGAVWSLDFRESAPLDAKSDTALKAATPGLLAGLDAMQKKFGTRPWKELVDPSITLARERAKGDLAATLTRIAQLGAHDFYDGALAEQIIEAAKNGGGAIGHRDLRDYAAIWRAPIRIRLRDYDIYAPAPPSSGGIVIGETMNILNGYDLAAMGFQSVAALHLITEAARRASIDRNKHVGDPLNARIPYRDLLSPERAAAWRGSMKTDKVTATPTLTEPALMPAERTHTTHFTIADASGNVVSMTTSIGADNGSGFLVPRLGFLLNDALNDFGSSSSANALASGKRPASSLSPTIVLKNGKPFLALGSSGGGAIPTTILQVLLNTIVYAKPLYESVAAPRYHQQASPDQIEYEQPLAPKATIDALNAMGHPVTASAAIGDVHAIMFSGGKLIAVSDPRSGGSAGGY